MMVRLFFYLEKMNMDTNIHYTQKFTPYELNSQVLKNI